MTGADKFGELRIFPVKNGRKVKDRVLSVQLDEGSPILTSTETGWEVISRPQKSGLVRWTGIGPITQDVPILIDGYVNRQPVTESVQALRTMAGIGWGRYKGNPPKPVKLVGGIHRRDLTWVISGITEGESIRSNGGQLLRYHAVISLTEYEKPDQIRLSPAPEPKIYIVKKGDTLKTIAAHWYGDKKWWKLIGNAQKRPIKDPDKKLTVGRELRMPRKPKREKDKSKGGKGNPGKKSRS